MRIEGLAEHKEALAKEGRVSEMFFTELQFEPEVLALLGPNSRDRAIALEIDEALSDLRKEMVAWVARQHALSA